MQVQETGEIELNVTLIEPRLKHAAIFEYFDKLEAGQSFCILNDHDPKPLYYQLIAERGKDFGFTYLENGPEQWRIRIRKHTRQEGITVGQIVAKDIRKAELLKSLGIDFCCGGKKTLKQVCAEKNLDFDTVNEQLSAPQNAGADKHDYLKWDAAFLADYIYHRHHLYYYDNLPLLNELMNKVAGKHGDSHPELLRLQEYFGQLQYELKTHFLKEEKVLFPAIKTMSAAIGKGNSGRELINLNDPIQVMEADHDMAGSLLASMAAITNNYTPPQGACNSFGLLYAKLKDLEDDLHLHVHLENNILFPKAIELQKQLTVSPNL